MSSDESKDDWVQEALRRECGRPLPKRIRANEAIELAQMSESDPNAMSRLMVGLCDGTTFSDLVKGIRRNTLDADSALAVFVLALKTNWRRRSVLGWLSMLGSDARPVLSEILQYVSDPDPETRAAVIDTIGTVAPEDSSMVQTLMEALQDEYPDVRWRAAESLGRIGPPANVALNVLFEIAEGDRNIKTRRCAKQAIVSIDGG